MLCGVKVPALLDRFCRHANRCQAMMGCNDGVTAGRHKVRGPLAKVLPTHLISSHLISKPPQLHVSRTSNALIPMLDDLVPMLDDL